MTEKELQEIRERAEAGNAWPWRYDIKNLSEDVPKLLAEVERLNHCLNYQNELSAEFLGKFQCLRNHFNRITDGEADSLGDAFQIAKEALKDVE